MKILKVKILQYI